MVEFEGKRNKERQRRVIGKDGQKKRRRTAGRSCDKTERSERAVSDTATERYPMMEGLEGSSERRTGRGGGEESGSIGLVGWRFIYNAERPEERVYLCGQDLRCGLQFLFLYVRVCLCVFKGNQKMLYTLCQ